MTDKKTRMPWECPDIGFITQKDLEEERIQNALGPVIEGGCVFQKPPSIEAMEDDYAETRRAAPGINGISPPRP